MTTLPRMLLEFPLSKRSGRVHRPVIRGMNSTYYGKPVTPTDIIIRREVQNPHSEQLREAIVKAKGGK